MFPFLGHHSITTWGATPSWAVSPVVPVAHQLSHDLAWIDSFLWYLWHCSLFVYLSPSRLSSKVNLFLKLLFIIYFTSWRHFSLHSLFPVPSHPFSPDPPQPLPHFYSEMPGLPKMFTKHSIAGFSKQSQTPVHSCSCFWYYNPTHIFGEEDLC